MAHHKLHLLILFFGVFNKWLFASATKDQSAIEVLTTIIPSAASTAISPSLATVKSSTAPTGRNVPTTMKRDPIPSTEFRGSTEAASNTDKAETEEPLPNLATPCNKTACRLPQCFCDAANIPNGLKAQDTPQMVLLAFDGAVNMHNYELYTQIFNDERRNPNGCPIRATFFISHRWTDYSNIQNLYAMGHDISLRGVALTGDETNATYDNFVEDITAFRAIAHNFADVAPEDMVGMRAPYLKTMGDDQFLAAFDSKLLYDSSILNPTTKPVWPFTLDYAPPFSCPEWYPPCPLLSYAGLWEIPVTRLVGPSGIPVGFYTAYDFAKNPVEIAETLMKFFKSHYDTNRAPFTLNGLSYWFGTAEYRLGFELFIEQLLRLSDVWIVTYSQLIAWMQKPTPLSQMESFEPFKCNKPRPAEICPVTRNCRTFLDGEEIYFSTCKRCPFTFPYLNNYNGCFNDPCPVPVVEYVDSASLSSPSLIKIVLFTFAVVLWH